MKQTFNEVAKQLLEAQQEIQNLQRALSFWHPGVVATNGQEFYLRAAHDAMLLVGYKGPREVDAIERGWITVAALRGEGGA